MVTHDQNVARVADNIMRIEDGTIKASLTPSQIAGPEVSTSYLDQLRKRVVELEAQMKQLDEDFKAGRINGDEYAGTPRPAETDTRWYSGRVTATRRSRLEPSDGFLLSRSWARFSIF